MSQEEIDATKAPLLDHLIELRARLIKALAAFAVERLASACFIVFFGNRAFWNARAPALLCKVALRGMAHDESS